MSRKQRSKALQRHFDRVGDLPCCVSGYKPATLHHCHGGSLREYGIHKGFNQKTSDWLIIPLAPKYHSDGGPLAIDSGIVVEVWEQKFGTQASHLDAVCMELGYNVWKRAGINREVEGVCSY